MLADQEHVEDARKQWWSCDTKTINDTFNEILNCDDKDSQNVKLSNPEDFEAAKDNVAKRDFLRNLEHAIRRRTNLLESLFVSQKCDGTVKNCQRHNRPRYWVYELKNLDIFYATIMKVYLFAIG